MDEIPKAKIKYNLATDIGNCIRIIKALLNGKEKKNHYRDRNHFLD
jgi:hypothetical protein